jgi:hypothetical protein
MVDETRLQKVLRDEHWVKLEYQSQNAFQTLTDIGLQPPTLAYAPDSLNALTGVTISPITPVVTGTAVTYTGALPAGLSLNPSTGVISGSPTDTVSQTKYVITATNGGGSTTDSIWIRVDFAPPVIAYTSPQSYLITVPIDTLAPVSTGGPVTGYAISPNLNALTGLDFNTTTGLITGTPTDTSSATDYEIIASGPGGMDTATVNITVGAAAPVIAYTSPQTYTQGVAIDTLAPLSTGGPIVSYAITPNLTTNTGLSFNTTTGLITGTPTDTSLAVNYEIIATGLGGSDTATVSITVLPPAPAAPVIASPAQNAIAPIPFTVVWNTLAAPVTAYPCTWARAGSCSPSTSRTRCTRTCASPIASRWSSAWIATTTGS